jgi:hypothetical protein
MKHVSYLSALASWAFILLVRCLLGRDWTPTPLLFLGGAAVFLCIGLYLMGHGVFKQRNGFIVAGVFVVIPQCLCGFGLCQRIAEIGGRPIPLRIVVLDARSLRPIPNAVVRVFSGMDPAYHDAELADGESEGQTAGDGRVTVTPVLTFTSQWRDFRGGGGIRFWDKVLEVTADDHQPVVARLMDFLDQGMGLHDPPPPTITVFMKSQGSCPFDYSEARLAPPLRRHVR